jgi:hypothetical protein
MDNKPIGTRSFIYKQEAMGQFTKKEKERNNYNNKHDIPSIPSGREDGRETQTVHIGAGWPTDQMTGPSLPRCFGQRVAGHPRSSADLKAGKERSREIKTESVIQ